VLGEVWVDESLAGPVVVPPDPSGAVVLYLPGEPVERGGPEHTLGAARDLAARSRATVVVCRYRSTFSPAFADDVLGAYRQCRSMGEVSVVGARMGGTLAAALLVQLRDWGAPPPQCAVLVSALLDLTLESNSVTLNLRPDPVFDVQELRRRVAEYAGTTPLTDPLLSPLHANLHGLAPVQILVAGTDLLLDDSLSFAARAARSGVSVDLRVYPEARHLRAALVPAMAEFLAVGGPTCSTEPPGLVAG
jgi:acetyl esterase/lipase